MNGIGIYQSLLPGEVDVIAPLALHLLVLRALGVHELLGVGTGGVVVRGRRGGRGR